MYALFHTFLTKAVFMRTKAGVESWPMVEYLIKFGTLTTGVLHDLDLSWFLQDTAEDMLTGRFKDCFYRGMPIEEAATWLLDNIPW